MIEPRPGLDVDELADAAPISRRDTVDGEMEFCALLGETTVELDEVLEYGIGSVIDLGSARQIRARIRFGEVDFAEGEVVTIDDASPDDGNKTDTHQKVPARRRLGVRLNDVSWERLGDVLGADRRSDTTQFRGSCSAENDGQEEGQAQEVEVDQDERSRPS